MGTSDDKNDKKGNEKLISSTKENNSIVSEEVISPTTTTDMNVVASSTNKTVINGQTSKAMPATKGDAAASIETESMKNGVSSVSSSSSSTTTMGFNSASATSTLLSTAKAKTTTPAAETELQSSSLTETSTVEATTTTTNKGSPVAVVSTTTATNQPLTSELSSAVAVDTATAILSSMNPSNVTSSLNGPAFVDSLSHDALQAALELLENAEKQVYSETSSCSDQDSAQENIQDDDDDDEQMMDEKNQIDTMIEKPCNNDSSGSSGFVSEQSNDTSNPKKASIELENGKIDKSNQNIDVKAKNKDSNESESGVLTKSFENINKIGSESNNNANNVIDEVSNSTNGETTDEIGVFNGKDMKEPLETDDSHDRSGNIHTQSKSDDKLLSEQSNHEKTRSSVSDSTNNANRTSTENKDTNKSKNDAKNDNDNDDIKDGPKSVPEMSGLQKAREAVSEELDNNIGDKKRNFENDIDSLSEEPPQKRILKAPRKKKTLSLKNLSWKKASIKAPLEKNPTQTTTLPEEVSQKAVKQPLPQVPSWYSTNAKTATSPKRNIPKPLPMSKSCGEKEISNNSPLGPVMFAKKSIRISKPTKLPKENVIADNSVSKPTLNSISKEKVIVDSASKPIIDKKGISIAAKEYDDLVAVVTSSDSGSSCESEDLLASDHENSDSELLIKNKKKSDEHKKDEVKPFVPIVRKIPLDFPPPPSVISKRYKEKRFARYMSGSSSNNSSKRSESRSKDRSRRRSKSRERRKSRSRSRDYYYSDGKAQCKNMPFFNNSSYR
eukprot:TRINITY_DN3183_c0_g2_i2.p1 TRINITY_DN3183_c0_g2~~TRINITY_DN3183_c0_g2_i2.p1  ORF type:complete len:827 (-),score=255.67 TRINITY_DN3183_c0_g2_i2:122-2467(-)